MSRMRKGPTAAAVLVACLLLPGMAHAEPFHGHHGYPGPSSLYPKAHYWAPELYRVWSCLKHPCFVPLHAPDRYPCLPLDYKTLTHYPVPVWGPRCPPYEKWHKEPRCKTKCLTH